MPKKVLEDVPFFSQGRDNFCGPASANMLLGSFDGTILGLGELFGEIQDSSEIEEGVTCSGNFKKWASAPDGLMASLNDLRPSGLGRTFQIIALGDDDALTRRVIWSLFRDFAKKIPQIVLVFGVQHWLVVEGYHTTADPSGPNDHSYDIIGIFFKDSSGIEHGHVVYNKWLDVYVGRVCSGSFWSLKSVALCSTDGREGRAGESEYPPPARRIAGSREIIGRVDAIDAAVKGTKDYGLDEIPVWKQALSGATPGPPAPVPGPGPVAQTVLVQRIDRNNQFYYLVPFAKGSDVSVLVMVDALTGLYSGAAIPAPGAARVSVRSGAEALELCSGQTFELPDGNLVLPRADATTVDKLLVWKPCRESTTPFLPFYALSVRESTLYMRTDGQVFSELRSDIAGAGGAGGY